MFLILAFPAEPYFELCDETNTYEIPLPDDNRFLNVTPSLLDMKAFDGTNKPITIMIIDEVVEEAVPSISVPARNLTVEFEARDRYGRNVSCNVHVAIIGKLDTVKLVKPPLGSIH